jgi:hypothetical protein
MVKIRVLPSSDKVGFLCLTISITNEEIWFWNRWIKEVSSKHKFKDNEEILEILIISFLIFYTLLSIVVIKCYPYLIETVL